MGGCEIYVKLIPYPNFIATIGFVFALIINLYNEKKK